MTERGLAWGLELGILPCFFTIVLDFGNFNTFITTIS